MKMRFFETVWSRFMGAFLRFPLASMLAFAATGVGVFLAHSTDNNVLSDHLFTVLLSLILTFGLVVAGYLLSEVRKKPEWMFLLPALVLGVGAYFWFKTVGDLFEAGVLDFLYFSVVVGIVLSLVPFFGVKKMAAVKKEKGYFAFIGVLLNLLLTAFVYFGALYLGLVLVLLSLEFLFELPLQEEWFADLFLVISGVLVSHFILAGLPKSFEKFEETPLMDAVSSFLPKYVLVPLTWVYLVVLYLYVGKIALTMSWPEGGVAGWILGFALVGLVTEIVLRYRDVKDFAYVTALRKSFYWLLLPLIVVLYMALAVRVMDYGMTEIRYFGFMMADFILVVTLYHLFSKLKSLRFVTGLLALMTLVAVLGGPLSGRGMSFNSQIERLGMLLVDNEVYVDGELRELPEGIVKEDYEEMRSIVDYLQWNLHSSREMNEYFGVDEGELQEILGLDYQPSLAEDEREAWIHVSGHSYQDYEGYSMVSQAYDLSGGFDYAVPNFYLDGRDYAMAEDSGVDLGDEVIAFGINEGNLVVDGEIVEVAKWFERFDLADFGFDGTKSFPDPEQLIFGFETKRFAFELRLTDLGVVIKGEEVKGLSSFSGSLLIRKK